MYSEHSFLYRQRRFVHEKLTQVGRGPISMPSPHSRSQQPRAPPQLPAADGKMAGTGLLCAEQGWPEPHAAPGTGKLCQGDSVPLVPAARWDLNNPSLLPEIYLMQTIIISNN